MRGGQNEIASYWPESHAGFQLCVLLINFRPVAEQDAFPIMSFFPKFMSRN